MPIVCVRTQSVTWFRTEAKWCATTCALDMRSAYRASSQCIVLAYQLVGTHYRVSYPIVSILDICCLSIAYTQKFSSYFGFRKVITGSHRSQIRQKLSLPLIDVVVAVQRTSARVFPASSRRRTSSATGPSRHFSAVTISVLNQPNPALTSTTCAALSTLPLVSAASKPPLPHPAKSVPRGPCPSFVHHRDLISSTRFYS